MLRNQPLHLRLYAFLYILLLLFDLRIINYLMLTLSSCVRGFSCNQILYLTSKAGQRKSTNAIGEQKSATVLPSQDKIHTQLPFLQDTGRGLLSNINDHRMLRAYKESAKTWEHLSQTYIKCSIPFLFSTSAAVRVLELNFGYQNQAKLHNGYFTMCGLLCPTD